MTNEVKSLWGCILVLFICVIILGTMLIMGVGHPNSRSLKEPAEQGGMKPVATIGDTMISRDEWVKELERQYGTLILDRMLSNKAVQLEASSLGIKVEAQEVNAELRRQMVGYDSVESYYKAMEEQLGMDSEQIYRETEQHLLLKKVATFPFQYTDEQVEQYIASHEEDYRPFLSFELSHIVTKDEEDAEEALQSLKEGESFADVAKSFSVDTYTSDHGGRLGWVEDSDPFIEANELMAARSLTVGQWSTPVKVEQGHAIVLLTGRKQTPPEDSTSIQEQARRDMALADVGPLSKVEQMLREKYSARVISASESS